MGAEVLAGEAEGVHFRVWAPGHPAVEVVFEGKSASRASKVLEAEGNGYFSGAVPGAKPGDLYRLRPGPGREVFPDPASRSQPGGPHGPSQVVNPSGFAWTDPSWRGPLSARGQVFYEMHVGTFTPEGTWNAAIEHLPALADLGITTVELMPIHEFPGKFGWGYDGVNMFAPYHVYGPPDDFRAFVDRAHAIGLAVILDVVYNHLGPDGNYLNKFSPHYFSKRHKTEWGEAPNFDDEGAGPVREFFLANAGYWVDEFHVDGLRVDATQGLFDDTPEHIAGAIAREVRDVATAHGRKALVVGESEPQRARLFRTPARGGLGYDMLWADDFHHSTFVAATGYREGYYHDYRGTPQELISAVKRGWLYQGQWDLRQGKRRGTPALDIEPAAFIFYLQNHDQVANSARGDRLTKLTAPGINRSLTALMMLATATPMLLQGQEFAASTPFLYFGDNKPEIAESIRDGRRAFLKQFASLATDASQAAVPDPADPDGFARSKLIPAERSEKTGPHAQALAMHRDLLKLRRTDPVFSLQRAGMVDGAVLGPESLALRWLGPDGKGGEGDDRLFVVNLGAGVTLDPVPEPLMAPPEGTVWKTLWSTEDPRYGGPGALPPEAEEFNWRLPAHSAIVLAPVPAGADEHRDVEGAP